MISKFFKKILDFIQFFVENHSKEVILDTNTVGLPPEPTTESPDAPEQELPMQPIQTPSKLDLWIKAITKMEGAKPSRNNPGNIRYIGQKYAVNDGGYCKFDTLEHGNQALRSLLTNAATGKSKIYKPTMTLYAFYARYAPSSDNNNPKHYAEYVASVIGVQPTIQIKQLVS